jgi:hypothetical protein
VAYLRHVISVDGVEMDVQKVQAIKDWPTPCLPRVVRVFLGLAGYYRRFVKDFDMIATPLTRLQYKEAFKWNDDADVVFQAMAM